jgi:hypothetical protein
MVISNPQKSAIYTKGEHITKDNTDLNLFLAYIKHVQEVKGISIYKLLKEAEIHEALITNIRYLLQGKKIYRPAITMRLLIKLYVVHGVPFNLSDYIHLIDKKD